MTGQEPSRKVRRGEVGEPPPSGQKVDNSLSTLQKLFQLYSKADLCDVQLQVENNIFHAHKLILSMSSDVFKTMLTDAKWPDARKARIVLSEEPECVQVFSEFVQYMYTGSIHLSNISVLPVLTLADKYNIHDLSNVCKQYMVTHCHATPASLKVVSWLQYAFLCGDHDLESKFRRYIELNFDHVMQSEDFLTMQHQMLEKLLGCEHLVIHSEFALFLGLKKWILHNAESSNTGRRSNQVLEKKFVLHLMSHVRLPLMKHAQLFALASDPLVRRHRDFFLPRLAAAWMFHSQSSGFHHKHFLSANHSTDSSVDNIITSERLNNGSSCGASNEPSDSDALSMCHVPDAAEPDFFPFLPTSVTLIDREDSPQTFCSNSVCSEKCSGSLPFVSGGRLDLVAAEAKDCRLPRSVMSGSNREGSTYHTPRNYTCDDWSTCLAIEDFASFPQYSSHTYFFSSPSGPLPITPTSTERQTLGGGEESDDSAVFEWQVELYPKGVRFPHAVMIGIPNNYDIDEHCQDVVRLAVMSKTHHEQPCHVDISVLAVAAGLEGGPEYMEAIAHKSCIFDKDRTIHNIDNIVSYHDLNQAESKYLTASKAFGTDRTCFKLVVIIKPA
ncbi:hypothetical protein BaRGS_00014919 [Batillaria attramentaria]|uniref:BTB domain-containing protein n=1 Tax=Batillaria attramentaria TaxID=370345 RepID=A0ABD0L2M3_9CAEN